MWKKIPLKCLAGEIFQVRMYKLRARGLPPGRQSKTLQGKLISKHNDVPINSQLQEEEIKNSKDYVEDPEGFGDLEADFMDVHKSHKTHEAEAEKYREQMKHWIIKNKYFKEKLPNFLTYSEKEQIKLLNSRDPDEWTPEKLSESFPADSLTISKILKAKWIAHSEKRIELHDKTVIKNWDLFKEGNFSNLNKELVEHLQKFANRTSEDLENTKNSTRVFSQLPVPKCSEFVSIITSCKKYKDDTKFFDQNDSKNGLSADSMGTNFKVTHAGEDEMFLMGKVSDTRRMRFEDFKAHKLSDLKEQNDFSHNENSEDICVDQFENLIPKSEFTEIIISQADMKTYEVSTIKEKIHIPRKLWRRGATYKVEDCYYDDDGEFMYRVPGMTGRKV